MNLMCNDDDCEYKGKKLVWIPNEADEYRLICPSKILTQTDYNLKYVKYESQRQINER